MSQGSYTYATLVASLESWQTEDMAAFIAAIPEFIGKAELRALRDLNLTIFDTLVTTPVTVQGQREVTKPDGWFMTRDVYLVSSGSRSRLDERTQSFCMDYAPAPATQGVPLYFYEKSDTQWYLVPTPNAVFSLDALVGVRPAVLSGSNDSNWLSTNVGDLLHAEANKQAAIYLKRGGKEQLWEAEYQTKLATARLELRSLIRADYSPVRAQPQRI